MSAPMGAAASLDLSAFSTWEEIVSLGLDRVKSALMALGLKCGGTLEERAQRLFSTKGKELHEIDASLFVKGGAKGKDQEKTKEADKNKKMALQEAQVYK